jgi:NADH-quinone oxidoreductase subunit G
LNPASFPYQFPVKAYLAGAAADMVSDLAAVLSAAATASGQPVPAHLVSASEAATVADTHRAAAQALLSGERRAVWLGALAGRHPAFADLRSLGAALAQVCGASFGSITEGANAAGAYLAGAIPHREAGAKRLARPGLTAREMLSSPLEAYVLLGVEPLLDTLAPESLRTLQKAKFVVALTSFVSEELKSVAHVLLPMGTFAESSGTYVNCEGVWQSQAAAAMPVGEARPGWKVLRVLGNLLNLQGFDYQSSPDVLAEVRAICEEVTLRPYQGSHAVRLPAEGRSDGRIGLTDVPMYQTDALVRRAPSLQRTREGRTAAVSY